MLVMPFEFSTKLNENYKRMMVATCYAISPLREKIIAIL